jgi:uncharacterized protein (TIGR02145 family)
MPGISVPRIAIPFQNQNVVFLSAPVTIGNITGGFLYNWYALTDSRNVAPQGTHVATKTELDTLIAELGGALVAGGNLKEIGLEYWLSPNTGATNSSGMGIRGNGYRGTDGVCYYFKGTTCIFTPEIDGYLWTYYIDYNKAQCIPDQQGIPSSVQTIGTSIYCLLDNPSLWYSGMMVSDYDNNTYNTVKIGNQVWLKQPLAVTHYREGTSIPEIIDNIEWATAETHGFCAYNNDWSYAGSFVISGVPSNAILNDDGTPIINDDGSYILTSD